MTLLGVLFVAGIAFLATMSFEADTIAALRQREKTESSIDAVVGSYDAALRDAMLTEAGVPFGGTVVGSAQGKFAELPGVQNLFAPLEPIEAIDPAGNVHYVFDWFTDVRSLRKGPQDGSWLRELKTFKDAQNGAPVVGIDAGWQPGVPRVLIEGNDPNVLTLNVIPDPDNEKDAILPVDADGDGVTDTLAFPLTEQADDAAGNPLYATGLGFSAAQAASLQSHVNSPDDPTGNVYLGLRVIPHGGMVNVNESHPNLVKNVVDLPQDYNLNDPPNASEWGFYFMHRPSQPPPQRASYAPLLEEPVLRRRALLPPSVMPLSLLQGNALLDPQSAPFGLADMPTKLYAQYADGSFDTVFEHRLAPFSMAAGTNGTALDPFNDDPESPPLWAVRMEPFTAKQWALNPDLDTYDRRHLVTTVSYDDLLSRGGQWLDETVDRPQERDLVELMRASNQAVNPLVACPAPLPFEYAVYPHDIKHNTDLNDIEGQECQDTGDITQRDVCHDFCRPDPRHGRLQLSLPWLDNYFNCNELVDPADGQCRAVRQRLIHDTFFMLLQNARGPYWDEIDCSLNAGLCAPWGETCLGIGLSRCAGGGNAGRLCETAADCPGGGVCQPILRCHDPVTGLTHRQNLISRTAASLTANMIDYMDVDGVCGGGSRDGLPCVVDADCGGGVCSIDLNRPTRVPLRSFDFSEKVCVTDTGVSTGVACTDKTDCGSGELCWPTAGWELGSPRLPGVQRQFVYGLERQPYITEVATQAAQNTPPPPPYLVTDRAVELFNPYDTELDLGNDYFLVEINPGDPNPYASRRVIKLSGTVEPNSFTVFVSGPNLSGAAGSQTIPLAAPNDLQFENGSIIYLVRRLDYPNPDDPGNLVTVDLALDQFIIDPNVAPNVGSNNPTVTGNPATVILSVERRVKQESPWTATVPKVTELPQGTQTLGMWSVFSDPSIRPVEVNFANTGSFTRLHPFDADNVFNNDVNLGRAFPTTGSLLLLMRHANRALSDFTKDRPDLAFTTWLGREVEWQELNPATGTLQPVVVQEYTQVDNGRMPVFDVGDDTALGKRFAHHVPPDLGACCLPGPPETCQDVSLAQCIVLGGSPNLFFRGAQCTAEKLCPAERRDEPGGLRNLPWGQLVFDYFTALPRNSLGPYENPEPANVGWIPGPPESIPRVDMNGLRVHGRININAAPWKVLSGLPLIPMERIPQAFRDKIRQGAAVGVQDHEAAPIEEQLAQGIVAYRELREVLPPGPTTGNYALDQTGRGWGKPHPAYRVGSGFLSVGELADIRHANAADRYYRIDSKELDQPAPDYVKAAALLVALGDWVTVRSDVFTVYGVLRGEPGGNVQEADTRAIRFQETVDRLPTFLGDPSPVRVGRRVVAPYTDVRDD